MLYPWHSVTCPNLDLSVWVSHHFFFMKTKYIYSWILSVFFHLKYSILGRKKYLVANIALRDEKVAASSFKAFSSFLSFVIVSVTIAFSFSYLFFRLARATSAVWSTKSQCLLTHTRKTCSTHFFMPNLFFAFINGNRNCLGRIFCKSIYIHWIQRCFSLISNHVTIQ